jgi:putative FmdB family regulatory protein
MVISSPPRRVPTGEVEVPTYQYACTESACGHRFDAVQSFSDDPLIACPVCEGRLRKVFSSVGVVFKGSGFYRTDSREASKTAAAKAGADGGSATKQDSSSASASSTSSSSGTGSSSSGSASGSSSGSSSKAAAS